MAHFHTFVWLCGDCQVPNFANPKPTTTCENCGFRGWVQYEKQTDVNAQFPIYFEAGYKARERGENLQAALQKLKIEGARS